MNFIDSVPVEDNTLPPAIDLEYGGNSKLRPAKEEFQKELLEYIKVITKHYKKKPILYITYEFYNDYLYPEFENYDLWVRDIYLRPRPGKIKSWSFWQYKNRGKVTGIKGFIDLNVFNGNHDQLKALLK